MRSTNPFWSTSATAAPSAATVGNLEGLVGAIAVGQHQLNASILAVGVAEHEVQVAIVVHVVDPDRSRIGGDRDQGGRCHQAAAQRVVHDRDLAVRGRRDHDLDGAVAVDVLHHGSPRPAAGRNLDARQQVADSLRLEEHGSAHAHLLGPIQHEEVVVAVGIEVLDDDPAGLDEHEDLVEDHDPSRGVGVGSVGLGEPEVASQGRLELLDLGRQVEAAELEHELGPGVARKLSQAKLRDGHRDRGDRGRQARE